MAYKFAFDLGSTSCGFAVVEIDDNNNVIKLVDLGVRIFPDGRDDKTKESLCITRRNARTIRVRQDRIKLRKEKLCKLLKDNGLGDFDFKETGNNNPYFLRAKAVKEKIELGQLGRILFQLCLRRGFKSNRLELKKEGGGKLKIATEKLEEELGDRTIGQFLYDKFIENNKKGKKIRFSDLFNGSKIKDDSLYPTREMYEKEFDKIWETQAKFYPNILTSELKYKIGNKTIFFQRPLKPQIKGFCLFEDNEPRIYKAEIAFQKFRALQTLNQLELDSETEKLSKDQRKFIKDLLLKPNYSFTNKDGTIKFSARRKKLKEKGYPLPSKIKFNLESDKRTELYVDTTSLLMSQPECFGDNWYKLSTEKQNEIIEKLLDDRIEDEKIKEYLITTYNLNNDAANNILMAKLESKTGSLSLKAINKIIPYLEEGDLYNKACEKAGYNHSEFEIKSYEKLPYYGDVLKRHCVERKDKKLVITNVSVHIALNQLRFIVNELIDKYSKPKMIAIELARDLKVGTKGLQDINYNQEKNKKENDKIREILIKDFEIPTPNKEDILKYKLWEKCNKVCIYTGKNISKNDLFSPEIEIEHILPFSRTFDDSTNNKILSFRAANHYKGNKTPYEAFKDGYNGQTYEQILDRASKLPSRKKFINSHYIEINDLWRFKHDAMEKFLKENEPIARLLNDTKHMSKMAVEYLSCVCEKNKEHQKNCYGLPGQMTALFREQWGLNWFKNKSDEDTYRTSHIHHAIDAFTVACMTRGQLQKIETNAEDLEKLSIEEGRTNYLTLKKQRRYLFKNITKPFDNFDMIDFIHKCRNIHISYKPKLKNPKNIKSTVGQLHEDTAYNLLSFTDKTNGVFVKRKSLELLALKDFDNIIDTYKDKILQLYPNIQEAFDKYKEYCENKNTKKVKIKSVVDFTTYIPIFRNINDRDEYFNAYNEYFINKDKSFKQNYQNKIAKDTEHLLLEDLKQKAKKAYKWFKSGNNFCAFIYQIHPEDKCYIKKRGKWNIEIMSNYMATINKGEPLWRQKHPSARLVMKLRINDMVVGEFNCNDKSLPKGIENLVKLQCQMNNVDNIKILFIVKKMTGSSIYLRPDVVARENADTKSWIASATSLSEYKARKVYVTPTGTIKDPNFFDKWNNNDTEHNRNIK